MNFVYAEVVQILLEDGMKIGQVRVGRAKKKVPLDLLENIECGDTVLLCDGVAISRVGNVGAQEKNHVSRNSR